jgi:hypothetical protein
MSVIFNKYLNKIDHTWYDSSNVKYSECYDTDNNDITLKVVFGGGRAYIYKGVSKDDYMQFRMAESNGKVFNECIVKKYKGVRLPDISMDELEKKKEEMISESADMLKTIGDMADNPKYDYCIETNESDGTFRLTFRDKPIFEGVEEHVSITRLFAAMGLVYCMKPMETPLSTETDFETKPIV